MLSIHILFRPQHPREQKNQGFVTSVTILLFFLLLSSNVISISSSLSSIMLLADSPVSRSIETLRASAIFSKVSKLGLYLFLSTSAKYERDIFASAVILVE